MLTHLEFHQLLGERSHSVPQEIDIHLRFTEQFGPDRREWTILNSSAIAVASIG